MNARNVPARASPSARDRAPIQYADAKMQLHMHRRQRHLRIELHAPRSGAYEKMGFMRAAQRRLRKLSFIYRVRRAAALTKIELHAPRSGAHEKNELCVLRSGAHEHGSDRRVTMRSCTPVTKNELHAPRSGAYEKNELCVLRSGAHEHAWKRPSCNQRSARPRTAQDSCK